MDEEKVFDKYRPTHIINKCVDCGDEVNEPGQCIFCFVTERLIEGKDKEQNTSERSKRREVNRWAQS